MEPNDKAQGSQTEGHTGNRGNITLQKTTSHPKLEFIIQDDMLQELEL